MEEKSGVKLVPTYSYAKIYKKGDVLHRHKKIQLRNLYNCKLRW